ncbi:MAG: hypothetical protein ABL893_01960 [Hyphomicrobium sp.]
MITLTKASRTSARPSRTQIVAKCATSTGAALIGAGLLGLWSATAVTAADSKKSESSGSWFSSSSKKDDAAAKPTQAAPSAKPATVTVEPAQGEIQTMEQLSKAGVKSCLQIAKAVGQATMFGTEYAAASTWNSKQPDNRFSVSMIGQKLAPNAGATNGISGVFSAPTSNGKCDAAAVQIIPTQDACAKIQTQVLEKGKLLGDLAGIPILQNAANAQVMLIPAASNSCVVVALSTAYTE